jgi:hypothetical protein
MGWLGIGRSTSVATASSSQGLAGANGAFDNLSQLDLLDDHAAASAAGADSQRGIEGWG